MSKLSSSKYISKLNIKNFRSYENIDLSFTSKNIVLVGENGSGKTNILEAISLISPGRGLRSSEKSKLFRIDPSSLYKTNSWGVHINLNDKGKETKISTGISADINNQNKLRSFSILGNIVKASEISSFITFNWLTPQMDLIISGPESVRRKFIDRLISNYDFRHLGRLKRLEKNLRERLIIIESNRFDEKWISLIERKISEDAIAIVDSRMSFVSLLDELTSNPCEKSFSSVRMAMKGDLESYIANGSALEAEDKYFYYLQKNRNTEKLSLGPNFSNLALWHVNSGMTADYCSTGQQKAIVLLIIIAQSKYLINELNRQPIVLLDEICSHLDESNREILLELIYSLDVQTFLTGTEKSFFSFLSKKANYYSINNN